MPSALTHVQSNSSDLPSVTALPNCQSTSQGYSIVLALTDVQSVHSHIASLKGGLLISKCTEVTYSPMNEKHTLNRYIKNLCASESVNQLVLCQYLAEFDLLEYIFSENPILVLTVHKLGVYFFILHNFLLDIWLDVSPLFCFVLELCHNIIIGNQNFMTNWLFRNSTGINPIYLHSLFFQRHLYSKHDFVAAIRNLFKNIIEYHYRHPRSINFLRLMFRPKQKTRRQCLYMFWLHHRSLLIAGIIRERTRYLNAQTDWKKLPSSQENLGGYGA